MNTSALERLRNMPECFTDKTFMRLNRLSPETTRVTLSRMKSSNLIQSAGDRSGVYFNLLRNENAANEHMINALLFIYPTAVLVGESVLHNAGWITQIPASITVAVLRRKSLQKLNGFSIETRDLDWFKSMNDLFLSADSADFTTYGLKSIPPEYALLEVFQQGGYGLDLDDVDIPDDKAELVSLLFSENGLDFGSAHQTPRMGMR
jgi:hypothetical protein